MSGRENETETHEPVNGLDRLLAEIEEGQLSSIRKVVSEVIAVLASPGATVRELKMIIEIDPPLAARILHLANSAFYSRGRSYSTIEDAIILLGFEATLRLVLSQKVCELFTQGDAVESYSRARLWRHSTATALLSRLIHRREFGVPGETAFACGLLHDLGLVIADQFRHQHFVAALKESFAGQRPLRECERERIGFDHGEVVLALAERWTLPREVIDCFKYLRDPFAGTGPHTRSVLSLFVANSYCRAHGFEHGGIASARGPSLEDALSAIQILPAALDRLGIDLLEEITQLEAKGLL